MNLINLPFRPFFKAALLSGEKTATIRTRNYGRGKFRAFGAVFEVFMVQQKTLEYVANVYYDEEGFKSPRAFRRCWEKIHPRAGFRPRQKVWLHIFCRVIRKVLARKSLYYNSEGIKRDSKIKGGKNA